MTSCRPTALNRKYRVSTSAMPCTRQLLLSIGQDLLVIPMSSSRSKHCLQQADRAVLADTGYSPSVNVLQMTGNGLEFLRSPSPYRSDPNRRRNNLGMEIQSLGLTGIAFCVNSDHGSIFLLGHASVPTTERYLGCEQNLEEPVNDRFGCLFASRIVYSPLSPG